ncbi:nicotianamine synthase [Andrographis paniculata]|uniref:nicotianamine synthase n=1 Tax=Andrographis paniculata TaxID=175694 RepID=UPI0021E8D420|nr:nicotianamine synthase [Andrographis paniculata]
MVCLSDPLVQTISDLYHKIAALENLDPSEEVNALFGQLVRACIPPHPIDVSKLCAEIQETRQKLIGLCSAAEGLLESHHAAALAAFDSPLDHLHLFPYYSNYLKLSRLELDLLLPHSPDPRRLAFIGSGPLPLTSIVLATGHLTSSVFDNFDINPAANAAAARLVAPHPDLARRMNFHTADVMDVPPAVLREYDVVFLAALVGMEAEEKMQVVEHLEKSMAPGAVLVVRSAHGARAFLYPVVDPRQLRGFEVLSVHHPTDEVINSVVVARKCAAKLAAAVGKSAAAAALCSKCGEIQPFACNPMSLVEELAAAEEHIC